MADNRYDLNVVLAEYPRDCRPIGADPAPIVGGFSGSKIWRLETARGPLCLRRWPIEHPTASRLGWIHDLLATTAKHGFALVPLPIPAQSGETFVDHGSHLWELTPWLPGEPDRGRTPRGLTPARRVQAAMMSLAEFHRAVTAIPENESIRGPAIGIFSRLAQLDRLQAGGFEQLRRAIEANSWKWQELAERSVAVLRDFTQAAESVVGSARATSGAEVLNRPCIRDIHREHVLFSENEVIGLIDFGAMQVDNVACDIARLMGSMAHDDDQLWQLGLSAYESVHPLSADERVLVRAYDESGVLLSGINWLRWFFIEDRQFDNPVAVLKRFDEITCRLANLVSRKPRQTV